MKNLLLLLLILPFLSSPALAAKKPKKAAPPPPAAANITQNLPCTAGSELIPLPLLKRESSSWADVFQALGEGRLCPLPAGVKQVLRFTWIRGFQPAMSVKVTEYGDHSEYVLKQLENAGGRPGAKPPVPKTGTVTAADAKLLAKLLEKYEYWHQSPKGPVGGKSDWILEAAEPARYHAVYRSAPGKTGSDGQFRAIGEELLKIGGVKVKAKDLY